MIKNIFALDLGNTRLKLAWYLLEENQDIHAIQPILLVYLDYNESKYTIKELNKLTEYYQNTISDYTVDQYVSLSIGSCVAGHENQQFVEKLMQKYFNIENIHWVTTNTFSNKVLNSYDNPNQLGIDRWISLVYCRLKYPNQPVVVVNAGTAVTIDMLTADAEFIGGIILPGIQLMQKALFQETAEIKRKFDEQFAKFEYFPRNTGDAVFSGVLFCLSGAIEKIRQQLFEYNIKKPSKIPSADEIQCILSGGDGEFLKPLVSGQRITYEPYLIINSLAYIALSL